MCDKHMPHTHEKTTYHRLLSFPKILSFDAGNKLNESARIWKKKHLKSRFRIKKFTTCDILNQKNTPRQILNLKKERDRFRNKSFSTSQNGEKFPFKKSRLAHLTREKDIFSLFCDFLRSMIVI